MKKITLVIFLTVISIISFSQSSYDLVYNDQMSKISAVSSIGMNDDQISMSSDPVLSLDINNNGILDYVVAKHALGEVYVLLDYLDFNNSSYTPQTDNDVVIINGALNLGVSFDKGDFNNDGIDDVILGASLSNIDGEAFIIFGSSNFLSFGTHNIINVANVHIQFSGFSGNADRFGDQVRFADLNNDNYDDAIISAPVAWYEGSGGGKGSIYVIYGSSNSPMTIQARTNSDVIIEGSGTFDHIGKYLDIGDFDNDGILDLSFSSPHWPGAGFGGQRGKVWIMYGENSLLNFYDASLTYNNLSSFEGHSQSDEMAYVSSGDFNGDNITDLIVSAGKHDASIIFPTSNNFGVVYVLYGPINRGQYLSNIETFSNSTHIYPNPNGIPFNETYMYIDANFGQSVSLFDVNNDAIDDIIIGMVGYSRWPSTGSQTNEGGAIIIYGTSSNPNTIYADGGDILFLAEPATCSGCPYNISFGRSVGFIETNDNKIVATIADNERNQIYLFDINSGCTDSLSLNYNALANVDDGSCFSCTISVNNIYNLPSNLQVCDGFIYLTPFGTAPYTYIWSNANSTNANPSLCDNVYSYTVIDANGCGFSDTIALTTRIGCMSSNALNYDSLSIYDDGSCIYPTNGCTDSSSINYNDIANIDDGSCLYCDISITQINFTSNSPGNCDGSIFINATSSYLPLTYTFSNGYNGQYINGLCSGVFTYVVTDDYGCTTDTTLAIGVIIYGCTDLTACGYNSNATIDDGSCTYTAGCIDDVACNYNSFACVDDGSCEYTSCATCNGTPVTGLFVSGIIDDRAVANFDNMNTYDASSAQICRVDQIRIKYREVGTSSWNQKNIASPTGYDATTGICNSTQKTDKNIYNLNPATEYQWQVKLWYCSTGATAWVVGPNFTTLGECPNVGNLSAYGANPNKATFNWDDSNGGYEFVRIKMRVDSISNPIGSDWFNVGGAGVSYPTFTKNKSGLVPGETYRGQARTWCDPQGGAYNSLVWTPLITWTQPTSNRIDGADAISNLDIYPNPSRDIFNVSFTSEDVQDLKFRILNLIGEELVNDNLEQFIGEYTKQIDLTKNAKGIYFLEIETNDGIINKKLILQ